MSADYSISKATALVNTTDFNEKGCQIYNAKESLIAEDQNLEVSIV